ncbi:MAG: DNA mismatch repair endonuclease MutL [Deltaproteobacteria bacterium]|nr:DNA mismatch repair endonuclease MutL [Deltaproteobacteria bacterium]
MTVADVIEVLPDHVVDQIAAGEVVERPASVVKELVENALDAGARLVTIDVIGGGRQLIRVVDDGRGMTPRDARLALSRHATSKLRSVDDLWGIGTMGFRGEALPSIASVARLTLTTRTADALAATRIVVEGGRVGEVTEVGAPVGTTIEVADLFANVPARLKFLKGDATEASHVTDAVSRLAMAHPEIHLRLRHAGRVALDAPPAPSAIERARQLLGPRLAGRLHPVTVEDGGIRVTALLAAPELAQSTARGVQLYVGRRAVRDRGLLHAVAMGYGELVPRGRYPVAIVLVDVPAGAVDVNVHPQKLEVRFSDAAAVATAVRHAVRRGVAGAPWLAEAASAAPVQVRAISSMAPPRTYSAEPVGGYARTPPSSQGAFDLAPAAAPAPSADAWAERMRAQIAARAQTPRAAAMAPEPRARALPIVDSAPVDDPDDGAIAAGQGDLGLGTGIGLAPAPAPMPAFFATLRYLGQLDRTYLVCEGDGELVLIDQHAAHERVEFQRLRERSAAHEVPVQRLLFPTTIEVDAASIAIVADAADVLAAAGFEVEPFGGTSVAIKAVPAGLRHTEPAAVLRQLLGELAEVDGSRAVEAHLDHVLATIACHSVVRAGDVLDGHEAEALLRAMDGVDFRAHCPHGRPVLLRLPVGELARRFGR